MIKKTIEIEQRHKGPYTAYYRVITMRVLGIPIYRREERVG